MNYYVSPSGNDRNNGTATAPWATISNAARIATAGAIVHVLPGTYQGRILSANSGTATAPITFISDVKWGAVVAGSKTNIVWLITGNYVTVQGFDITGDSSVSLGILMDGSYGVVSGNHVHDLAMPGCNSSGGAAIDSYDFGHGNNDVVDNEVNNIAYGMNCRTVQGIYYANTGGHVYNNIVYRISGFGIQNWHAANGVTISNNLIFECGASGIIVGNGDSPGGTVADNFIVTNNILMQNGQWGIIEEGQVGSHNVYMDNLVYENNAGGVDIGRTAGHTSPPAQGTITQSPMLLNFQPDGSGNYHLAPGSPAIDHGTTTGAPAVDLDGVSRFQGGGIDIGPYQWIPN